MRFRWILAVASIVLVAGCGRSAVTDVTGGANVAKIVVTSTVYADGQAIPKRYTGEGDDVSPALRWGELPAGTKELALIMDDPDAPGSEPWVHWVMYKIAADSNGLPEGAGKGGAAGVQGKNSFGKTGYNGPMPPKGHGVHRYHLRIYALDAPLALGPEARKAGLLGAMKGHVLGIGELMGTYERK